jgi:hypothetical protein
MGKTFRNLWKKCGIPAAVDLNKYELQRFNQIKVFSKSIAPVRKISIDDRDKPSGMGRSIAVTTENPLNQMGDQRSAIHPRSDLPHLRA